MKTRILTGLITLLVVIAFWSTQAANPAADQGLTAEQKADLVEYLKSL